MNGRRAWGVLVTVLLAINPVRTAADTQFPLGVAEDSSVVLSPPYNVRSFLGDRQLMSDVLMDVARRLPFDQLLVGLALEPRILQSDTSSSSQLGLGLHYSYTRALTRRELPGRVDPLVLGFELKAEGTAAFDRAVNPADFLSASFQFGGFRFGSGLNRFEQTPEGAAALQEAVSAAADFEGTEDQLDQDPAWQRFMHEFRTRVLSQAGLESLWDFDAHASIESDQRFVQKQYVYGVGTGLLIRDHRPGSPLQVFDAPFALLRVLTGSDQTFQTTGQAVPAFSAALDMVTPTDQVPRERLLGESGSYPRFRCEAMLRSSAGADQGKGALRFTLRWRYFHELGSGQKVRDGDFATFSYFTGTADMASGWQVVYTSGRLPFDQHTGTGLQLGWSFKFE